MEIELESIVEGSETPQIDSIASSSIKTLAYVKGAFGSGKSSIAYRFLNEDPDSCFLRQKGDSKILATVFPKFNIAAVGKYKFGTNCGGSDTLNQEKVSKSLELLSKLKYDVYFEGAVTGNVCWPYYELLLEYKKRNLFNPFSVFLDLPIEVAADRVGRRTGGEPIEIAEGMDKTKLASFLRKIRSIKDKHRCGVLQYPRYLERNEMPVVKIDTEYFNKEQVFDIFCSKLEKIRNEA